MLVVNCLSFARHSQPFWPACAEAAFLVVIFFLILDTISINDTIHGFFFLFIESNTTNLTFYYTDLITIQYYGDDTMGSERQ